MPRNLGGTGRGARPHSPSRLRARVEELLGVYLADDRLAWELVDDDWTKIPTVTGLNAHLRFQALARRRSQGALPDPTTAGTLPRPWSPPVAS